MKKSDKYILESKEIDYINHLLYEGMGKYLEICYSDEPIIQSTIFNFLSHYKEKSIIHKVKKNKSDIAWENIHEEYDLSKSSVSKILNRFIPDNFKRHIILRDIGNSYALLSLGFTKESIIIAGSVIEEILRLYVLSLYEKNFKTFYELLQYCGENNIFKNSIHKLTDSVREFRNLVHISKETDKSSTINKSDAKAAVSSIFSFIIAIKNM